MVYFADTGNRISMEELRAKITDGSFPVSKSTQWFDNLEEQGVIFLNATLTVRQHEVDTHTEAWKTFMDYLIRYIENINQDVVWCLLGAKARDRFLPKARENNVTVTCYPRLDVFVQTDLFARLWDRINFIV